MFQDHADIQRERDQRGFFRGLKDSIATGTTDGCLSAAVDGAGYSWDFEQTEGAPKNPDPAATSKIERRQVTAPGPARLRNVQRANIVDARKYQ